MGRTHAEREPAALAEDPGRRAATGNAAAVLELQRLAGNRAVGWLLRGKKKNARQAMIEQSKLKAAPNQSTITFAQLPATAQPALQAILNGNPGPYLRPNGGFHATDPETGLPKGTGIGVREYHVTPSNESMRFVARTVGQAKSAYWDGSHVAGTYTYHRITDPPFPVAAPAPAPAPAVAPPAAAAPVVAPPPAPAPGGGAPVRGAPAAARPGGHAGPRPLGRLRPRSPPCTVAAHRRPSQKL